MVPWVHLTEHPKRDLDGINRSCTAHGRQSLYTLQWAPSPKIAPSHGGSGPHLTHCALGPPKSITQRASRSVQPFLQGSRQNVPILQNGPPFSQTNCHYHGGIRTPSNTWFLGSTRVLNPNAISIGSAVFAGLTTVTDRQTDRQTTLLDM